MKKTPAMSQQSLYMTVDPCLAEAKTTLSMAAAAQEPAGPCSTSHLTSAEVSVCPESSGPLCLASAEAKTTLSMAAAAQEPAGPCSTSHLTSAEVSVCPESSGPSCLASAEAKTTLSMAAAAQEPAGPCSTSHLTSAEVSVYPKSSGPSRLASAEAKTTLSMAAAAQEPAGPCSISHLTSAKVINNDVYHFEPDWFSLGIKTYMMATELRPFRCRTYEEYKREVNFRYPVYPPDMDPDVEDFIKGLLCKYPDERLGIGEDGRSHPFLDSIDWEELGEGRTPSPFPVDPPMDMEIRTRLSPSALHQHPKSSHLPEEEVYIPRFTYISSA